MILTLVKSGDDTINNISIKGSLDNPYLALNNQYDHTELGTYPKRMNILDYQSMNNDTVLDSRFLASLWYSMKIGPSQFKLDEGLYFSISPLGITKRNRGTEELESFNFSNPNEFSPTTLQTIMDWCAAQGFTYNTDKSEIDVVRVDDTLHQDREDPLVSYKSNILAVPEIGGPDYNSISEEVLNIWKFLDNDRFMKILPTNTNFGNHIILTQYKELSGNTEELNSIPLDQTQLSRSRSIRESLVNTSGVSNYREIKIKVKHKRTSDHLNREFISTHNLCVDSYSISNMVISNSLDGNIQVTLANVSQGSSDPVLAVKLTWNKLIVDHAVITDLVLFDNALNQL